jgi:hypothetical protein
MGGNFLGLHKELGTLSLGRPKVGAHLLAPG